PRAWPAASSRRCNPAEGPLPKARGSAVHPGDGGAAPAQRFFVPARNRTRVFSNNVETSKTEAIYGHDVEGARPPPGKERDPIPSPWRSPALRAARPV